MVESRFSNNCQGGRKVAEVHLFRVDPERISIKLDRSGRSTRFLGPSWNRVTTKEALSIGALVAERLRSLIAPSAKFRKQSHIFAHFSILSLGLLQHFH